MKLRRVAIALLALPLAVSACGGPAHTALKQRKPVVAPKVATTLAVTPAAGTTGLPVTTEIGTTVSGGVVTQVTLTDPAGHAVGGAMRPDASSWVPAQPLAYHTTYHATVTALGSDGQRQTRTTSFTTMADPGSGNRIGTGMYFFGGQTYGVGMPIAIEFSQGIPDSAKASVERRLFVTSDPPQIGVWHWYGDRQVIYRPEHYWQPGTKLTVRAALGGLPVGNKFIDQDRGGTATIGDKVTFLISNKTKQMQVYQNDKLVRTFPVSLGKASTPSSSGNLVLMSHDYETLFDVPGEYRVNVFYAERLTWDGQYIHAAPWSVADQGHRNVSHGCVNLSNAAAKWVYDISHIGDPVTITGTGTHVPPGDGWTVWDMDWRSYVRGSALPHDSLLAGQARLRAANDPGPQPVDTVTGTR